MNVCICRNIILHFPSEFKEEIGNIIGGEKVKIKLELDVAPSDHQAFEKVRIKSSFSAEILAHDLPTCMGQKIHAVLCRSQSYGMDIVKGRDLYDLEWYLKQKIKPNLKNLSSCLNRMGPWKDQGLNVDKIWIIESVDTCLSTKDFSAILLDVKPLVNNTIFNQLQSRWNLTYFRKSISKL